MNDGEIARVAVVRQGDDFEFDTARVSSHVMQLVADHGRHATIRHRLENPPIADLVPPPGARYSDPHSCIVSDTDKRHNQRDTLAVNRTERLHAVAEELRRAGRTGRTAGKLAQHFEVSTRTVKRDVAALQQGGLPVWAQPGPGGGYAWTPL